MKLADFRIPGGSLPVPSGIPSELQGGLQSSGSKLLQLGLSWLVLISFVIAVIFLMYSGIEWITSRGEPDKIARAKARLLYSIVGLVIVAFVFFIINNVLKILDITPANLGLP